MSQRPKNPPDLSLDLETTAELPIVDFTAVVGELAADRTLQVRTLSLDDPLSATDKFAALRIPDDLQTLTSTTQTDVRPVRTAPRTVELEAELAKARVAATRELAAQKASATRELAAARDAAARELAAAQAAIAQANAVAEERAARLAELAGSHRELAADVAARRAALDAELAQARQALEAEAAKTQAALEADAAQARAAADAELARLRQVLEQERAAAAGRTAGLEQELLSLRRQVLRQQELLGTRDGERGVLQALIDERERELDAMRRAKRGRGAGTPGDAVEDPPALQAPADALPAAVGDVAALDGPGAAAQASRIAELETEATRLQSELAEALQRAAALEERVEDLAAAVAAADGEAESRADAIQSLTQRAAGQGDAVAELEQRVGAAEAAATEAQRVRTAVEDDLRAAEEQLHRVEAELRQRDTRLGDLQGAADPLRARVAKLEQWLRERDEEVERLAGEAAARAAVLVNLQESLQHRGADDSRPLPAPGEALRMLVRLDGPEEVVHVLGRRTTIGRTPDNGLQVNAGYVSRHHAVLLLSERQAIIEDLNSTNGVLVNGHRVTRSLLRDGDTVTIGKADFRYDVRGRSPDDAGA